MKGLKPEKNKRQKDRIPLSKGRGPVKNLIKMRSSRPQNTRAQDDNTIIMGEDEGDF